MRQRPTQSRGGKAPVVAQYFEFLDAYARRYRGRKVVVVMQIGNFFRLQGAVGCGDSLDTVKDLASLLRLQTHYLDNKRVPSVPSHENPLLIGYPTAAPDEYFRKMTAAGYWVVVVEEVHDASSRVQSREVTQVLTDSMLLHEDEVPEERSVMLVYEECTSAILRTRTLVLVVLKLVSGNSQYYTRTVRSASARYVLEEDLERWLHTHRPVQVVSLRRGQIGDPMIPADLERLSLPPDEVEVLHTEDDARFHRPEYQEQLFRQYLPARTGAEGALSRIDDLGWGECPAVRVAFAALLSHLYDMDRATLLTLRRPSLGDTAGFVRLAKNSIKELHVVHLGTKVIRCQTGVGRRLLLDRLTSPSVEVAEINARLDHMEACGPAELHLKPFERLEIICRRMATSKAVYPRDAVQLIDCLRALKDLPCTDAMLSSARFRPFEVDGLLGDLLASFDESALRSEDPVCIFHDRLVEEQRRFAEVSGAATFFLEKLRACVGNEQVSFVEKSLEGFVWIGPKSRLPATLHHRTWTYVADSGTSYQWGPPHVTTSVVGNNRMFVHGGVSYSYARQREHLLGEVLSEYRRSMQRLHGLHREDIHRWLETLAELDVAMATHRYGRGARHVRPVVVAREEGASLEARELRHPLVEETLLDGPYVPNDFELTATNTGLMLYGINSSGKSSAMRSIGLAVVMAQAGLLVPATALTLSPFTLIMTRILGGDDLLRGKSTYTVEMLECLPIAEQVDRFSLVLGDEIAHSTDIASGTALVASLMDHMVRQGVKFVLATHMRALETLAEDSGILDRVAFRHFHVEQTGGAAGLVFHRTLRDGTGPASYGLDVAEYLGLPAPIILAARRKLKVLEKAPDFLIRVSRYDRRKIYTPDCVMPGCRRPAVEEDHVVGQKQADGDGFLPGTGTLHKHHMSNLQGLCRECHRLKTTRELKCNGGVP